ncbi:cellobiose transport system permease protein [Nocardioides luteus]|uniref:Sugar ABC transporter permease n=1 Tax=Nocardioides luteus TaxID=1844 RepID=A0ABQ5SWE4_9ACTN|nr:carbohydrate ABC transporter permease [Nocardioides luteus]MDR7312257.1 cellobiose transport system permease protein [Nocardioides luteus]GGR57061.1 sugar ABC transporter permease [Nocardioides luteus]GLJ68503.1 sugar ABC transporter permease [Nocardioides luteus]
MTRRPGFLVYGLLTAFLLGSAFPLYWSFVIGSVTRQRAIQSPPPLMPGGHFFENAGRVLDRIDFWSALLNSIIVSGISAVSVVLFSTLAGYAFAKLRFRGANVGLVFVVATLAVPTQLALVPMLKQFSNLGLTGTHLAVILPWVVTAFGVFFMRQYLVDAIPDELIDAARVDGCSMIRTFWTVAIPAARPAMAILGLFTFMQVWTDFMWPLIVLQGSDVQTLQTALDALKVAPGQGQADMALVQAGTIMATIPLLLLFIATGRHLVSGIMQGAVKG